MYSQIEKEFDEYESNSLWPQIYQKVKYEASLLSIQENLTFGEARKPENRTKNRYKDVSPYDHSRVVLQKVQDGESDYINASVIEVPKSNRRYILSQGPLEHTAGHFWQMVWEQNCKAIIMLNKVIENKTLKCHQYWPLGDEDEDDEMLFKESNFKVTLQEEQENQHYVIRTFDLENLEKNEVREVYHFHYTTWPDFGVPSSPDSFLMFLDAVRAKGVLESDVGPAVIHCSAGIGRSGTFCLVDSALVLVEKNGSLDDINIQSLLISMRSYRMGLIQTYQQFKFSYMAIIAGGRKIVSSLKSRRETNAVNDENDEAPPPPARVESLLYNRKGQKPPPPPPRSYPVDEESKGEPLNKVRKLDTDISSQTLSGTACSNVSEADVLDSYLNVNSSGNSLPMSGEKTRHPEIDSENNNPNKDNEVNVENSENTSPDQNGGQQYRGETEEQSRADGNTSDTHLRQRRQEERQKRREKTQELINKMKEKQHKCENWKKSKSYIKPVAIGLTLLIGSYLIWRVLW